MAVPDFQSIMLPFLEALQDGQEVTVRDLTALLANRFSLAEADRQQLLPSGEQTVFSNRVSWAKAHLKNAGLIESPSRGRVRISDTGLKTLSQKPGTVNCRFLRQFPSYLKFIGQAPDAQTVDAAKEEVILESTQTPQELLEASFNTIRKATAEELLSRLKACSPGFFEVVVVRLLREMGYGGVAGEASVTGKSGDGGIDGVI